MQDIIPQADKAVIKTTLLPYLQRFAKDEQDSIRLWVTYGVISLIPLLTPEECKAVVIPIFRSLVSDPSWKVRFKVGELYCDLAKIPAPLVKAEMITPFVQLLKV